jgi:hypothetical protein
MGATPGRHRGEHPLGALDRLRATFRWKAGALDSEGLQARIGASSLTVGGLLKHLALVGEHCSGTRLSGAPPGAPTLTGRSTRPPATPRNSSTRCAGDTPEQLYALRDDAVKRSRARLAAALADGGPGQLVHVSGPDGRHASLRRLICDLIEEYGRHTGHADLLREAVDGLTGEDPPAGWRARAAAG